MSKFTHNLFLIKIKIVVFYEDKKISSIFKIINLLKIFFDKMIDLIKKLKLAL